MLRSAPPHDRPGHLPIPGDRDRALFGVRLSSVTLDEAVDWLLSAAEARRSGSVFAANVHSLIEATRNRNLREAFEAASLVMPDGMPLVWALRSFGDRTCGRTTGPDTMALAMNLGRARDAKHFLFGGSAEACADLKCKLEQAYPGVEIAGCESPPFRTWTDAEQRQMLGRMRESGANLFWIALGAPKQELWLHQNACELPGPAVGVGAAFDFLRGAIPRAPRWIQRLGLEWLFRLASEPRRLWRRYLSTIPRFLLLWTRDRISYSISQSQRNRSE